MYQLIEYSSAYKIPKGKIPLWYTARKQYYR